MGTVFELYQEMDTIRDAILVEKREFEIFSEFKIISYTPGYRHLHLDPKRCHFYAFLKNFFFLMIKIILKGQSDNYVINGARCL